MDITQMEYFIAVCDHHGITPAAETLFLTPQALSKSIRKLEEELNSPLFFRETSGLRLTPFGEKALDEMRRLTEDYRAVRQRLRQISAQENGQIRLACANGLPNALPLEALRDKLAPAGICLDIMELPDLLAEEMVQKEVVDLALTIGAPRESELLQGTLLRRYRLCAVVNETHPFAQKEWVSVKDLAGQPIITKSPYFQAYRLLEEEAERQGVTLNYALNSSDELRFIKMVESGEGIGIGVSCMDTPKLRISDSLIIRPFAEELPWEVYLTTRKGHYLSDHAHSIIEQIKAWGEPPTPHSGE